jgi:hypothetical protein
MFYALGSVQKFKRLGQVNKPSRVGYFLYSFSLKKEKGAGLNPAPFLMMRLSKLIQKTPSYGLHN